MYDALAVPLLLCGCESQDISLKEVEEVEMKFLRGQLTAQRYVIISSVLTSAANVEEIKSSFWKFIQGKMRLPCQQNSAGIPSVLSDLGRRRKGVDGRNVYCHIC